MFVANDKHRQLNMFSSITSLPQDELNLLEQSWAAIGLMSRYLLKTGRELSASSLNSPDDVEATFRRKNQTEHVGYVANLTENLRP